MKEKICIKCKWFAIAHEDIPLLQTDEERQKFIQEKVVSNGVCVNPKYQKINPVTGILENPFAYPLRISLSEDACGPEGKGWEPIEKEKAN